MRRDNMTRFMVAPALLVMLFVGCVKRDLEMRPVGGPDGYAEIALDWGVQAHPKSAHFLFYDESGKLVKEAIGITDGFKGPLSAGTYRIVVHNEDAINVDYQRLDNYAMAVVFALAKGSMEGSNSAAALIEEPRQVFGTGIFKEFDQLVIEPNKRTTATVEPKLMTREVQFLFKVKGLTGVRSLEGVLGGVTSGVFLATGLNNNVLASSVKFSASPLSKSDDLAFVANIGVFNLLTTPESAVDTNTINLTLTDHNGMEYKVIIDLTKTLKEIIGSSGGVIPVEIPVEVVLEVRVLEGLTTTVRPWDNSGSGSGDPRP